MQSDFRQACISKIASRREKQSEIWASGVSVLCTQGAFDTSVIKVILSISDFQTTVSRKRLVVEQNEVKFGPRGGVFSVYRVLLTLKWLK